MGLPIIVICVVILLPTDLLAFQQQQQIQTPPSTLLQQHPHRRVALMQTTTTTTQLGAFLPANTALSVVDNFWKSSPYAAAALTCAVKGSIADLVAQKIAKTSSEEEVEDQEQEDDLQGRSTTESTVTASTTTTTSISPSSLSQDDSPDWKRNIAYVIYGSIYQGVVQEYVFNRLYPMLFGYGTDLRTVLMKVAFNLLVHSPFITIPIAYLVKAVVYKDSVKGAMAKYWSDIKHHGLLKKFFLLWGPIQCLTFSIVPEHYRISFIAAISFFWMVILSLTASKPSPTLRPKMA